MNSRLYKADLKESLIQMLSSYFVDDLHEEWTAKTISRISNFLIAQHEKRIVSILIAFKENIPVGFAVYQVDTKDSDWCKRAGWGFIREFYIQKNLRRIGIGRFLATEVEQQLLSQNIKRIYLTTDNALEFWLRCGYTIDSSTVTEKMFTLINKWE